MTTRWRLGALTVALVLVETASYIKLAHWLFWTNEPWLAYGSALAFVGLLLASIVVLGSDVSRSMRNWFYVGGTGLFLVQALANVLIAYQYGLSNLPVDVVTAFFGVGSELALKSMAVIQGSSLSIVSLSFWSVIGQLLRDSDAARRLNREEIRELERIFQEEGR